jgi:dihydroorotase
VSEAIRILNARAADSRGEHERLCVGIRDGRIVHAAPEPPEGEWDRDINAEGLLLLPGWVELAARLREPGATRKADIASELAAAAAGGITALCMPPDTQPVIDRPAVVDWIRGRVSASGSAVAVHLLGAATVELAGTELAEMHALAAAGCAGVAQYGAPLRDTAMMRRVLEYAAGFGLTLHVQPQDAALADDGCAHEGAMATRLGLPPIPVAAETCAIGQWLALIEDTGARLHFGRISSARGARMIARARADGLPVSADVALTHLLLDDSALAGFDTRAHLQPPLRETTDRDALRAALAAGDIGALCCDHQPHEADAKNEAFDGAAAGASGLDSAWCLALWLVEQGVLDLPRLVAAVHDVPLAILGQPAGGLVEGASADLVLIDPSRKAPVDPAHFTSRGRNTPLAAHPTGGGVVLSMASGHIIHEALDDPSRRR